MNIRRWRSKRKLTKTILPLAFEAPAPQGKREFLQKLSAPPVSMWRFVRTQAAYISSLAWIMSSAVAAAAFLYAGIMRREWFRGAAQGTQGNTLWFVSAVIPILALVAVAENARSEIHGMEELELASRFSLKSVVLARMELLGGVHFALLCTISFLCRTEGRILQTVVYIFVPYLATVAGSTWIVRRIHGREALYGCAALAAAIGVVPVQASWQAALFDPYKAEYFGWWMAAFVVMAGLTFLEYGRKISETEEMVTQWNL